MIYPNAYRGIDWTVDTIKAALFQGDFVLDSSNQFISDIAGTELSGGGYSRLTLASKTNTATPYQSVLDCADLVWTGLTASNVAYLVVFKDTGTPGTSRLIGVYDLRDNGNPRSLSVVNLTIQWANEGVAIVRYE